MIESIMFFVGGFLVAGLLALVLISFVHNRAVRLTLRRLEDAIPVSLAEIQADKDKLRAEFAMSSRRLEMNVEQLKAKATQQLGELARKSEAIAKLKAELAEKIAITDELEARARSLGIQLHDTAHEYAAHSATAETTAQALAASEAGLTRATSEIGDLALTAETQKVEIAALKAQVEQFKARIDELQHEAEDAARRLFDERIAVSTLTKALDEKHQASPAAAQLRADKAENDLLRERITDIAAQVAQMSVATEKTGSPVAAVPADAGSVRPDGYERGAKGSDGITGNLADRLRKLQQGAARVS
jgi:chromosome segregation ATPase